MDTNMIIDVDNANHVVNLNHNEGNTNKEKEFLTKYLRSHGRSGLKNKKCWLTNTD